jgi:stage IV sporulation protein FB
MIFKVKKINIFVNILLFLIFPFYIITSQGIIFALVFLWATLHETAHIVMATYCKSEIRNVKINPFGLSAEICISNVERPKRIAIIFSGVVLNIFAIVILYVIFYFFKQSSDFILYSIYINAYLVFFNMLPIIPLDGSRILNEFLASINGYYQAAKTVNIISKTVSCFIFIVGVFIFILDYKNYGLLLISIFLIVMQKFSRTQLTMDRVKNLLYKKERALEKPFYETRQLAVPSDMQITKLMKVMDYDMFHIIYVLNSDMKIIDCLTEQEIMSWIEKGKGDLTLYEILNLQ